MKNPTSTLFIFSLLSTACSASPDADQSAPDLGAAQQPEAWTPADDPALFSRSLERNIEQLPRQGEASSIPWPGSYWPTYQDSINYRWDGADSLSPTAKYEKAFGGLKVEDQVSSSFGVDSQSDARSCTQDSQCDVSACGKRAGARSGRCVPIWYGICHGWAPAAILFPEPEHRVVENGVTFKVQDIKALLSLALVETTAKFVSLRCDAKDGADGAAHDAHGRPVASDCRDTNPGTFHIILTNYLGIRRQSFVEDRTFDLQVWNQPLRGYKVLEERPVSGKEANRLIDETGRAPSRYLFNDDADSFVYVKNEVSYIMESSAETDGNLSDQIDSFTGTNVYEYILELDQTGEIIGGEWVGSSKHNHPDFLWLPTGPGADSVAGDAIRYKEVKRLADASVAP